MLTIENFIHGIANVTKSLKASICGDSLIVNRICYDYETSNDYEELFAQISLEQIQPIIFVTSSYFSCHTIFAQHPHSFCIDPVNLIC